MYCYRQMIIVTYLSISMMTVGVFQFNIFASDNSDKYVATILATPTLSDTEHSIHSCVHTTNIFPYPTMKVGGRWLQRKTSETVVDKITHQDLEDQPRKKWKPFRVTLHWGLDASIPPEDTIAIINGKQLPSLPNRKYAVIEPLTTLRPELYGGYVRDLYSIGEHTISDQAILFVPENEYSEKFAVIQANSSSITVKSYSFIENEYDASMAADDFLKASKHHYFCENEISLSLAELIQVFEKTKKTTSFLDILRDRYYYAPDEYVYEKISNCLEVKRDPSLPRNKFYFWRQPGYSLKAFIKHTVGEFRHFRRITLNKNLTMLESDFFEKIGLTDLVEPYLLHIESELMQLERLICQCYQQPFISKSTIDNVSRKLNEVEEKISNKCPNSLSTYQIWAESVRKSISKV